MGGEFTHPSGCAAPLEQLGAARPWGTVTGLPSQPCTETHLSARSRRQGPCIIAKWAEGPGRGPSSRTGRCCMPRSQVLTVPHASVPGAEGAACLGPRSVFVVCLGCAASQPPAEAAGSLHGSLGAGLGGPLRQCADLLPSHPPASP